MHSQFEPANPHQQESVAQTAYNVSGSAETTVVAPDASSQTAGSSQTSLPMNLEDTITARVEAVLLRERFLDQVCHATGRVMVDGERETVRQELRTHLALAATSYEELGSSPLTAMQEAVKRFGNPALIGKGLRQSYLPSRHFLFLGGLTGLTGAFVSGSSFLVANHYRPFFYGYDQSLPAFSCGALMGLFIGFNIWRKHLSILPAMALGFCIQIAVPVFQWSQRVGIGASFWYRLPHLLSKNLILGVTGFAAGAILSATAKMLRELEPKHGEVSTPPVLS